MDATNPATEQHQPAGAGPSAGLNGGAAVQQAAAPGMPASFPLIGAEGASFVSNVLADNPPPQALRQIQAQAGLQQPLCGPLLGLLDQQDVSRHEAYRGVLLAAKKHLISLVQQADAQNDRVRMERLLNSSFRYLGIQDLRDVPLAVMEKLEKVPPIFLKQLTADRQIFAELPRRVQRQVWEFDKNLLQNDALPRVGQYKYEVATIMRALAADEFLPAAIAASHSAAAAAKAAATGEEGGAGGGAAAGAKRPRSEFEDGDEDGAPAKSAKTVIAPVTAAGGRGQGPPAGRGPGGGPGRGMPRAVQSAPRVVTRKILRKGSFVVQTLKEMVGGSQKIYNQLVELCVVKFRDGDAKSSDGGSLYVGPKELSYCTLRAQLLMALHDDGSLVATKDKCHELAWTIDAGITNGHLTTKHLQKLEKYFQELESKGPGTSGRSRREPTSGTVVVKIGKGSKLSVQDAEESAGNVTGSVVEPLRVLGDASVICRDPSAMHLLAAAAIQMVEVDAVSGRLPRDNSSLIFVLRMMQLAVEGRQMLRDRTYRFPEADESVVRDLLPVLGALHLECEMSGPGSAEELKAGELPGWGAPEASISKVQYLLPRSEVARRLMQAFTLGRLLRRDLLGAARGCALLGGLRPQALAEGFDFAGALALRLADLVKTRALDPTSSLLWRLAVDNILVKVVDSHTQVHEEVLRLLLAAAPQLDAEKLGKYLTTTLENSKKSRRRERSKKAAGGGLLPQFEGWAAAWQLGSDMGGSDIGSDGWPGISKLKLSASDGVRSVYARFAQLTKLKPKEAAPALHAYLEEDAKPAQA